MSINKRTRIILGTLGITLALGLFAIGPDNDPRLWSFTIWACLAYSFVWYLWAIFG